MSMAFHAVVCYAESVVRCFSLQRSLTSLRIALYLVVYNKVFSIASLANVKRKRSNKAGEEKRETSR